MNINEIIKELQRKDLISEIPEGHDINRKEREYLREEEIITSMNPYDEQIASKLSTNQYYKSNIENYIWIEDGDIDILDIDLYDIDYDIEKSGTDAIAWYRSYHWYPSSNWGIYMLNGGLFSIARQFKRNDYYSSYSQMNTLDYLQESYRNVFLHEYFHFLTDIAATTLEMASPNPIQYYRDYINNVYLQANNRDEPVEEALANAFVYRKEKNNRNKQISIRLVSQFMSNQPRPYRNFNQFKKTNNFIDGIRRVASLIADNHQMKPKTPLEILYDIYQKNVKYLDVPIYIVNSIKSAPLRIQFVNAIPRSQITKTHKFEKEYNGLRNSLKKKFEKQLDFLAFNVRHRSLNFEKLKGKNTIFTIRVDKGIRASLRPNNGAWEFLRVGEHDDIYYNPGG